ncbi:DUF3040 domain-containing protein [Crossiella cryophila]|uniref:DUF3040 domain-containing protein n=1 Tax=Crossiella cryophila TaxID=43355 RepID=A0A7W7FW24_9PSEU|nr:DUF3040 domain-containing protein [Crossiella cryophila]MBB4679837.1 hypothetical protein [Crossiella cryophila]
MALRDHEQRALAEIERRLAEEDPRLAERFLGLSSPSLRNRQAVLALLGVLGAYALGLTVLVIGVSGAWIELIVLGAVISVSVLAWFTWKRLHRR